MRQTDGRNSEFKLGRKFDTSELRKDLISVKVQFRHDLLVSAAACCLLCNLLKV